MFRQIIRNTFLIGLATFISRVFGFLRDILIAFFFGTSPEAGAFVVSFRLPNIWRSFVGEEAVKAAILPLLSEYRSKGEEREFWRLSFCLLKFSSVFLLVLAILGVIFSPILVRIIAPGFLSDPYKYELTVKLTRFIFPYIFLVGLTAVAGGILMARRIFWSFAWAPVILNLSIITSLTLMGRKFGVYALAVGILIGGILHLLLQLFVIRNLSPPKISVGLIHPEYRRVRSLLLPRFLGAGVYQINILVDTILASLEGIVGLGAVSALYYAQRFVQLPLAVFATALATAIIPFFSEQVVNHDMGELRRNLGLSLRSICFLMLPTSLGLYLLSDQIISVFLEHGNFTSYSTYITSLALRFYALGLLFYAGIKVLVSTFYSLQDTFTPVKVSSLSLLLNVGLSLILMFPFKVAGLCLATSISAFGNFLLLLLILKKRVGLETDTLKGSFLRVGICSFGMLGIVFLVKRRIIDLINIKILALLVLILLAVLSYGTLSLVFNREDIKTALRWKRRG